MRKGRAMEQDLLKLDGRIVDPLSY